MRKQALLLLLLTAALYSTAQTKTFSRLTFSLLGGPAFPVGGYYGMDKLYPHAGPVHTGLLGECSADYWINRYLGITLLAGEQQNRGNGFPYHTYQPDGHFAYYDGSHQLDHYWKIGRALTGVTLAYPVNKKQNLDVLIRLLGGIQWTRSADYYNTSPGNPNIGYSQTGIDLPRAFCGETDAGIKWHTGKHLALIAYAGYAGSSAKHGMDFFIGEGVRNSDITVSTGEVRFYTGSFLLRTGIQYGW